MAFGCMPRDDTRIVGADPRRSNLEDEVLSFLTECGSC